MFSRSTHSSGAVTVSLAPLHPQIVHFVIALLFAGVVFRCIAVTGRAAFTGPAAAGLLPARALRAGPGAETGAGAPRPGGRGPGGPARGGGPRERGGRP